MMKRKKKTSIRTLALLAATLVVLCGGLIGTNAKLTIFSEDYIADFELDHLHVHLIENGVDVCHGENTITSVHRYDSGDSRDAKYHGNLLEKLGYSNDVHYTDAKGYQLGTPGTVEPGRTYKEEISAANGENINQYVRLTVKKYWVDPEGKKATYMDPALIKLAYKETGGKVKAYNTGAWQINPKEHTLESDTYYLTNMLPGAKGSDQINPSALLFNQLTIDGSIMDEENMHKDTQVNQNGNKITTVYTYTYDYDQYTFYIEADVQAIQTHNVNDAIDSLWGIGNVSASGGKITVGK